LELRDLIVTPLVIILVYGVAYMVRPLVSDQINRVYFFPALTVKIIGALAVGFIYQFYYGGGDTFTYHTWGSRKIWEAFLDSPITGLRLLFSDGTQDAEVFKYSSKIYFFADPSSYAVVKVAAVMDLLTFSSYSATAILFAAFSFIGMWLFFLTFYEKYPHLHQWLAVAAFFIPSVFFWGSGILKDTITLGCVGASTFALSKIFIERKSTTRRWVILIMALYGLWSVKIYILLTFLPAAIIWIFMSNLQLVRSLVLKMLLFPFVISVASILGYFAIVKAGEDNTRYSIENLGQTARITAYDIRYYTGRYAGSGYELGELDGTLGSMFALSPQAINVSLFRPYLWEVRNPLMLLSALESLFFLIFAAYILIAKNVTVFKAFSNPDIAFSTLFSLSFAFAVGVSTFNFGSLVRYKIPMLPFFLVTLVLILNHSNSERKFNELDTTE
jgi:hypothetical protein